MIILENGKLHPIEIKKSTNPKKDAVKNFSVLDALKYPQGKGAVISMSPIIFPIDEDNIVIPIGCI